MYQLNIPKIAIRAIIRPETYHVLYSKRDVIQEMLSFGFEFIKKYKPSETDLMHKNLGPLTLFKQLNATEEEVLKSLAALGLCCLDNYKQFQVPILDALEGEASELMTVITFPPYQEAIIRSFIAITAIFKNAKNNGVGISNEDIFKMLLKILKNLKELENDVETFVAINLILLGALIIESVSIYNQQMQCN
jgi:hypothetical protein